MFEEPTSRPALGQIRRLEKTFGRATVIEGVQHVLSRLRSQAAGRRNRTLRLRLPLPSSRMP